MYFVLFCSLFIAVCSAEQTYIDLPAEVTNVLVEKSVGCIAETGAESNILQRVLRWQFDNNETSKKFAFCLFKNSGLIDDAGHFYEDKTLELYEKNDQQDEIKKVFSDCNKIVDKEGFETMYKVLQCFYNRSPVLVLAKTD
ncbi:unnamed protein product, partial [Iphiclides podalirius]